MILPTIHLNGTSRASLQADYAAAAHTFEDFIEKWGEIQFNVRDYYVSPDPDAWENALIERQEMSIKIRDVKKYLNEIREHIY